MVTLNTYEFFPNGLDGTGDPLLTMAPFWTSKPIYINSATGTDAAGNGTEPEDAYATLAYAITTDGANADGRLFVLAEGHEETVTSTITIAKAHTIVGNGSDLTRPKLTRSHATNRIFAVTGAGAHFRNLYIGASTGSTNSNDRIYVTVAGVAFIGCYFECGALDQAACVMYDTTAALDGHVESCTFISATTAAGVQPLHGLGIANGSIGLWVRDTIFDGGQYGFDGDACYIPSSESVLMEGVTLRRGADIQVTHGTDPGSIMHVSSASRGAKIY